MSISKCGVIVLHGLTINPVVVFSKFKQNTCTVIINRQIL